MTRLPTRSFFHTWRGPMRPVRSLCVRLLLPIDGVFPAPVAPLPPRNSLHKVCYFMWIPVRGRVYVLVQMLSFLCRLVQFKSLGSQGRYQSLVLEQPFLLLMTAMANPRFLCFIIASSVRGRLLIWSVSLSSRRRAQTLSRLTMFDRWSPCILPRGAFICR